MALLLRCLFGCLVLFDVLRGNLYGILLYGGVWVIIAALAYLSRREPHAAVVDSILLGFFIIAWLAPYIGIHMVSSVFGIDKVFHTTGGALLGLVGLTLGGRYIPDLRARAAVAVLFAIAVGSGWEVLEWFIHLAKPAIMQTTYDDTMLDIIADAIGAMLAAGLWYFWSTRDAK